MATRCSALTSLGLSLLFATGCPEPDDEAGDEAGETGDTGDSSDTGWTGPQDRNDGTGDAGGGGVEEGGDVRAPNDTGDGDGDAGDGDGDGDDDGDEGLEHCWDRTWNDHSLPAVIFDNTIGRDDDFIGSCGIGAAPDFQLGFIAPWAGSFTFDTEGSSFDTVVYVNDGQCGTHELACNDDFIGLDSKLTVELAENELVTVHVDGAGPFEEGPFILNISEAEPPTCQVENIVPVLPTQVLGDTTGGPSELVGDCGGTDAPEHVFEFVAPGPGSYRFDTAGSSFDTVLYSLDACDGPPLDCSDDVDFTFQSELFVDLEGGQKVLIVVDGHDANDFGSFVLNVEEF